MTNTRPRRRPGGPRASLRRVTHRRLAWPWLAVAVTVALLVAELGVRAIEGWLPVSQAGDAAEVELKYDQLRALEDEGEGTDVVFFGNSAMDAAVDPQVWGEASQAFPRAYNASLLGQPFDSMRRWAADFVLPHCDPALVVIGVTPFDVPQLEILGSSRALIEKLFDDAMDRLEEGPLARLDRRARARSAVIRHRASFRAPRQLYRAAVDRINGEDKPKQDSLQPVSLPDGRVVIRTSDVWEDELLQPRGGVANYWGVDTAAPLGFTFETAEQREIFRSSRTSRDQLVGFRTVADDAGADVVFVIPPARPDAYVGFTGSEEASRAAVRHVRSTATDLGVRVVDFSEVDYPANHFADPVHLNRRGSERFSRELAAALDRL